MKFLTLLLTLGLFAQVAFAQNRADTLGDQFKLNQATQQALQDSQLGNKVIAESERVLRAVFNYSTMGGTTGSVNMLDASTGAPAKLPKGAIIRDCIIDVITAPTSGGSSAVAFGTGNLLNWNNLKAATNVGSYSGRVACVPVGTAATAIKTTVDSTMRATVATNPLTAGKIYVIVQYEMSDTQ